MTQLGETGDNVSSIRRQVMKQVGEARGTVSFKSEAGKGTGIRHRRQYNTGKEDNVGFKKEAGKSKGRRGKRQCKFHMGGKQWHR
jgi:hypothetical protein